MNARVLKHFTMGSRSFQKDQHVDLPEDRIIRLVGEGLVETIIDAPSAPEKSEPEATPAPRPQEAVAPVASVKKSSHKKKR